ncbi:MAG TPA: aminotransferase class I/II-fold pyridoxal phosphate-dependent enzyme, partial [Candidatus Marinimicrobia bacterium]|nr:aminotransferase class I/II-fold pyridoxal phosphate-dependent enzyme [Candidatus Neomarinimicrobiota bacterium]
PERVLIILDEAYYEFAQNSPDYPDSMSYRYDNVITLRTFSKAYGLAGIRIGYGFAHESLINNLLKVKVPFEPSLSAQAAGMAAMDDNEFLKNTLGLNKNGMTFLKKEFDGLGIEQVPSAANFITTIWDSEKTASKLTRDLLEKGVIVRKLRGFGWPNCIRISVGLESENQKCIESLKEIL